MTTGAADEWFEALPDSKRVILLSLRQLITSSAEGIVEEIKWSRPCYRTEDGPVCYLYHTEAHCTLGFNRGTSLTDQKQLLEGTGKDMRHIKVVSADDVDEPAFRDLIVQAISLLR